jgi:hypothetical protein
MDYIKCMVWQEKDRILASEEPAAEVTNVLYERARDYFLDVV